MNNKAKEFIAGDEVLDSFAPSLELSNRCMRPGNGKKAALAAIANAESAMEELSDQFAGWMSEEVDKLSAARAEAAQSPDGVSPFDPLFTAAHDIKGQASTLGFPHIGQVCASLCRLLEAVKPSAMPNVLLDQHVEAVRAMAREGAKCGENPTAAAIVDTLTDVVEHFIKAQAEKPQ